MPLTQRNTDLSATTPAATRGTPFPRHRMTQGLIVLGVVATTGIALAGPGQLMRELRARWSEQDRSAPALQARPLAQRRAQVAGRPRSTAGSTSSQLADIPMNLTYVDTSRTSYTRFRTWVDNAVNGSPGYAYEARDSALMFRITRDVKYCNHAVSMVEQQEIGRAHV